MIKRGFKGYGWQIASTISRPLFSNQLEARQTHVRSASHSSLSSRFGIHLISYLSKHHNDFLGFKNLLPNILYLWKFFSNFMLVLLFHFNNPLVSIDGGLYYTQIAQLHDGGVLNLWHRHRPLCSSRHANLGVLRDTYG